MILLLLAILLLDPNDLGTINDKYGIKIQKCHEHDKAIIHAIPEHGMEGWFTTTNQSVAVKDLSMLPDGTNVFEIRVVCRGMTGEVSRVQFNLQRPPPPPKVVKVRLAKQNVPMPPIPGQMITPLPGGTNETYSDYMERLKTNKRRSQ